MWRLIYAIPTWLVFIFVIDIPLMLLGWILIPIAAALKRYEMRASEVNDKQILAWKDAPMWVYGNEEDGINGGAGYYAPNISEWTRIVLWTANRNPTNNLRYIQGLNVNVIKERVGFIGSLGDSDTAAVVLKAIGYPDYLKKYDNPELKIPQWFFIWQGAYCGWYWQFNLFGKLKRLWIGWKLYPTDILPDTQLGYRLHGAGFALSFRTIE